MQQQRNVSIETRSPMTFLAPVETSPDDLLGQHLCQLILAGSWPSVTAVSWLPCHPYRFEARSTPQASPTDFLDVSVLHPETKSRNAKKTTAFLVGYRCKAMEWMSLFYSMKRAGSQMSARKSTSSFVTRKSTCCYFIRNYPERRSRPLLKRSMVIAKVVASSGHSSFDA